jgi:sarcosine oxidase/L-pipecolate oxidase
LNESSGWVEASKALQKVIEAAVFAGVKCIELDISSLVFDNEGACVGVQSTDGQVLSASHIILATGAETVKLLVESATDRPNLHPGNRLSTAGLITGVVKLDQEEAAHFRTAPAFLHAGGSAQGMFELKLPWF